MASGGEREDADAARRALAAKLEDELDEFISSLQASSSGYRDGWPEDRWEEEMDKHPFFMKQAPDLSSGELPPLIEGLARLKFDPENNTPLELAANYKEDGNFYYKNKKYRLSIVSYTEGLKIKCEDDSINAVLHNNRSMSHFMLENYRSSLNDCESALKYDPNYRKCKVRAARCAFKLLDFELCLKYCDELLSTEQDKNILKLKRETANFLNDLEKKEQMREKVLTVMRNRGIKIYDPCKEDVDPEFSLSAIPSIEKPAHLSDDGTEIIWPVIILYPLYNIYDYYQEFLESSPLSNLIEEVLSVRPEWDERKEYKPETVNIYYIGKSLNDLHYVDVKKSLSEIMREKDFYLHRLSPIFIIKPKV